MSISYRRLHKSWDSWPWAWHLNIRPICLYASKMASRCLFCMVFQVLLLLYRVQRRPVHVWMILGGPVQDFPPFFFFPGGNHLLWSLSKYKLKQTDEQQRERQFLTTHINRLIALANYCTPINHIIWLHQCQSPIIWWSSGHVESLSTCPEDCSLLLFFSRSSYVQKLHAHIIYALATNQQPNNCNRMHTPLSNHPLKKNQPIMVIQEDVAGNGGASKVGKGRWGRRGGGGGGSN